MPLITVFFPGKAPGTFRRAIIQEDDLQYFKQLGAESRPEDVTKLEPPDDSVEEDPPDPERGWGEFGSVEWHQNQIRAMESRGEIADYIKRLTGVKMKTKGITLKKIKRNALTNIRRAANGSKSE